MCPADTARVIAGEVLGRDPGPLTATESRSHHVYVGTDVVVKIIDAGGHSRLDREITLAPHLPAGLTAPLLGRGLHQLGERAVRYACYARVPGTAVGMGMPGVDEVTARSLAEQAVQRLDALHRWTPEGAAARTLAEVIDHGGFVGRTALVDEIDTLAAVDRAGVVPRHVFDGLTAIAEHAPARARTVVPVHADCHWDNWLTRDRRLTALLDFEWARFGEPTDDWFFLARFSGPHLDAVLEVITRATATPPETLRAACEIREAAYLTSDLRAALERSAHRTAEDLLRHLDELVVQRLWWHSTR